MRTKTKYCGYCKHFKYEDSFGDGWCAVKRIAKNCSNNSCEFLRVLVKAEER